MNRIGSIYPPLVRDAHLFEARSWTSRWQGWVVPIAAFIVVFGVAAGLVVYANVREREETDNGVAACRWIAAHRSSTTNFSSQEPRFAASRYVDLRAAGLAYLAIARRPAASQVGYSEMTDWTNLEFACQKYGARLAAPVP